MRLTPPPSRGLAYDGTLSKSCWAYDPCIVCSLCKSYDSTAAICTICEDRKRGVGNVPLANHHCVCTESQRQVLRAMTARFNRPLGMLPGQNYAPIDAQVPLDSVNEDLYKRIQEEFHVETKVIP